MRKVSLAVSLLCVLLQSACRDADPKIDLDDLAFLGSDGIALEIATEPGFHIVSVDHRDGPIFLQYVLDAAFVGDHVALSVEVGGRGWFVVIDEAGRPLMVGGPGDGPGEFARAPRLFSFDEALLVWDRGNSRLTRYSRELEVTSEDRWETSRGTVVGVLHDGHIVSTPFGANAVREGEARTYDISTIEGEVTGQLVGPVEPPIAVARIPLDSSSDPRRGAHFAMFSGECFAETLHAVGEGTVVIADSQNGVLYSSEYTRSLVSLISQHPQPVSRRMLDVAEDLLRRSVGFGRDRLPAVAEDGIKTVLERIGEPGEPLPSTWSKMLIDRGEDQAWLLKAACLDHSSNEVWDVVSLSQKTLLGQAQFPPNMRLLAVDRSRVLVSIADAMDVRSVALFRIGPET